MKKNKLLIPLTLISIISISFIIYLLFNQQHNKEMTNTLLLKTTKDDLSRAVDYTYYLTQNWEESKEGVMLNLYDSAVSLNASVKSLNFMYYLNNSPVALNLLSNLIEQYSFDLKNSIIDALNNDGSINYTKDSIANIHHDLSLLYEFLDTQNTQLIYISDQNIIDDWRIVVNQLKYQKVKERYIEMP